MNKNALQEKSKGEAKRNFEIKCFKGKVSEGSKNHFWKRILLKLREKKKQIMMK